MYMCMYFVCRTLLTCLFKLLMKMTIGLNFQDQGTLASSMKKSQVELLLFWFVTTYLLTIILVACFSVVNNACLINFLNSIIHSLLYKMYPDSILFYRIFLFKLTMLIPWEEQRCLHLRPPQWPILSLHLASLLMAPSSPPLHQ